MGAVALREIELSNREEQFKLRTRPNHLPSIDDEVIELNAIDDTAHVIEKELISSINNISLNLSDISGFDNIHQHMAQQQQQELLQQQIEYINVKEESINLKEIAILVKEEAIQKEN